MKAAVIVFPASNCERDAVSCLQGMVSGAWGEAVQGQVQTIWHQETTLPDVDVVVLPGGFSYGDYLRSGAMAARSPIMQAVIRHAARGGYVIGICNGFQILTEARLLDGALMRNRDLRFICKTVTLRVERTDTVFTKGYNKKQVLRVPVAHHDGNFYADTATIERLEDNGQILFRYVNEAGETDAASNINGSLHHIAGIINEKGNVLGMMPHPERVCDAQTGGTDGRELFLSLAA